MLTRLAVILAVLCCTAFAQPPDDPFTGASLDTCKWDFDSANNASARMQNGLVLVSDGSQSYSAATLFSQYYAPGNFDVQVDYQLGADWNFPLVPSGSGPHLSGAEFAVYFDSQNQLILFRNRSPNSDQLFLYGTGMAQSVGTGIPANGLSGSLRIRRSGTQVDFLTLQDNAWAVVGSWSGPVRPAVFWLGSANVNAKNAVTTTFRNFRFASGSTNFKNYQLPSNVSVRPDFVPGFVSTDHLPWSVWGRAKGYDPFPIMAANGMGMARIRITTLSNQDLENTPFPKWGTLPWRAEYWASLQMGAQELLQAQSLGMQTYLELFLSDTAADAGRQNAPPEWRGLSVEDTAVRLEQYTFATVSYLKSKGIKIDVYSPGNEIFLGLLNFLPGDRLPAPVGASPYDATDFMEKNVWPTEARLLKAAIAGIRRADPIAKILLHAEGYILSPASLAVEAFFRSMVDQGVPFDYAGISVPYMEPTKSWSAPRYSTTCWYQRMDALFRGIAALGKKGVISEASYQNSAVYVTANAPMQDFPLTPDGQAAWINAMLRFASNQENIFGFNYTFPEAYLGAMADPPPNIESMSLFANATTVFPGMKEFNPFIKAGPAPKINAIATLGSGRPGPFAPGEYAVIYGENLARLTTPAAQAPFVPVLGAVAVNLGGKAVPVQYVSPGQINFLIPAGATPGSVPVTVTTGLQTSAPSNVVIGSAAPDILIYNGNQAIAQNFPSYTLNGPSTAAPVGSAVIVYVVGLGQTIPIISDGAASPVNPPALAAQTVSATINGQKATVLFAGMTPQAVGLGQVNVVVPAGLPSGNYPLVISVGGQSSNIATLSVR